MSLGGRRLLKLVAGSIAAAALLAGCDKSEPTNDSIRISEAWVEASVKGRDYTPAYVTIRSSVPDKLVDANVDGDIAEHTLLYRTHDGGDAGRHTTFSLDRNDDGRLFSRTDREFKPLSEWEEGEGYLVPRAVNGGPRADHVNEIPIDSFDPDVRGGMVPMYFGGYYMLLTGLPEPLRPGSPVNLELEFEKAGKIEVRTRVRERHPDAVGDGSNSSHKTG